ncbi:MAG: glycosyltransferase, partial [Chloroflexota bacterium]
LAHVPRLLRADASMSEAPFEPALIHAHTGYPDGAAAAQLAEVLQVPLIITEHATFLHRQLAVPGVRDAYLKGALSASRLLAVSEMFASDLRLALPEVADRVAVMPNTVDIGSFQAGRIEDRKAGELLFVGYWKEIKGIDILLKALAIVRRQRGHVTLRLVGDAGDPVLDRRWRALADDLGVSGAVTFDGPLDRAGVALAMQQADIFVHASRFETFGVVAAEALASGLPLVATDSGGVTEILGERAEELGALVARDDVEAFAAAILRVLDRRATYDPERLRASVAGRYGAVAVAQRLVELYGETIDARLSTSGRGRGAGPHSTGPSGQRTPTRTDGISGIVAVAFDPDRAIDLMKLSMTARSDLVLVTSHSSGRLVLDGFSEVVYAPLQDRVRAMEDTRTLGPRATGWRRLARAFRHPFAAARRRGLIPGLTAAITGAGSAAVRQGILLAVTETAQRPMVVCADGVDYLAARSVIEAGLATPAPGGLRWLADHLSAR